MLKNENKTKQNKTNKPCYTSGSMFIKECSYNSHYISSMFIYFITVLIPMFV